MLWRRSCMQVSGAVPGRWMLPAGCWADGALQLLSSPAVTAADVVHEVRTRLPSLGYAASGGAAASCDSSNELAGGCDADGCRRTCVAVHAWLLVVLGTLLPLAVCWLVEESSRCRFLQGWLESHTGARSQPQPPAFPRVQRLNVIVLGVCLLLCACLLWLALEALILPVTGPV
jgi:hypothetical protein